MGCGGVGIGWVGMGCDGVIGWGWGRMGCGGVVGLGVGWVGLGLRGDRVGRDGVWWCSGVGIG